MYYNIMYSTVTVEPPNKGHIGINSAVLSFIERLSSVRRSKCTKTIGHVIFGTSNSVLCREVYYTVSLISEGPLSEVLSLYAVIAVILCMQE